jgi:hypothetical protein
MKYGVALTCYGRAELTNIFITCFRRSRERAPTTQFFFFNSQSRLNYQGAGGTQGRDKRELAYTIPFPFTCLTHIPSNHTREIKSYIPSLPIP